MVVTIKTYYPSTFLKNIQITSYCNATQCCSNEVLCTLWKTMFTGTKMSWFLLASSLELFYMTIPAIANDCLSYGMVTIVGKISRKLE